MNRPYRNLMMPAFARYRAELYGTKGAISSNNPYATKVGLEILKQGGNAADAAVAVSLTLGLVEPFNSGIGGGCFTLYYDKKDNRFYGINARGVAPAAATTDMFLGRDGEPDPELCEHYGKVVATPTMYRAYEKLLREHGTMTLREVSAPAIRLAREGFHCGFMYARASEDTDMDYNAARFEGFAELYLEHGKRNELGDLVKNPDLADTMEQVAEHGADWFYNGPIAKEIVSAVQRYSGIMTEKDLADCRALDCEPVRGTYRNCYGIVSMAPPSSGGIALIQMLNILENFDLPSMGRGSAESLHLIAEAMKLMFADHSVNVGDPVFVDIPLQKILSKEYAKELSAKIDLTHAQAYAPTEGVEAIERNNGCTTHFNIQDQYGNMLSQTQTVRSWWASGVVVPGRGFVLNNNMSDFSAKTGSLTSQGLVYAAANAVRPGKTPLSSMMPTIVTRNGVPFLTIGSAGGPRIITSTLGALLNVLDYGTSMEVAINSPELCSLSQNQGLELDEAVSPDTVKLLVQRGHKVNHLEAGGYIKGYVNGIECRDGKIYPSGSLFRSECGGSGVLTDDFTIITDGFNFEQ